MTYWHKTDIWWCRWNCIEIDVHKERRLLWRAYASVWQTWGLILSFCAKAATLVAEEIEFLGGKAILENIFARPGTSSGFIWNSCVSDIFVWWLLFFWYLILNISWWYGDFSGCCLLSWMTWRQFFWVASFFSSMHRFFCSHAQPALKHIQNQSGSLWVPWSSYLQCKKIDWLFWLFTESSQLELGPHPCVTARIAESSWSRHKPGGS